MGMLSILSKENGMKPGTIQIVFLDRMDLELAGHLNRLRISCLSRYNSVARLSWWAAGDKRQIKVFEALAHDVRVQDKLPTAE
ncbi:hypothetical protein AAHB37_01970 [Glutamicibacter halophytocola]|uniref:hypothetical protein n=1 Tax=Glutamicibacter halophytocola TaxID=1933880 RepID=UPI00321A7A15